MSERIQIEVKEPRWDEANTLLPKQNDEINNLTAESNNLDDLTTISLNVDDQCETQPLTENISCEIDSELLIYSSTISKLFENINSSESSNLDMSNEKISEILNFFVPNWHYFNSVKTFDLVKKDKAMTLKSSKLNMSLFEFLINFLKDDSKLLYHDYAYVIMIQFFHEKFEGDEKIENFQSINEMNKLIEGVINDNYRKNICLFLHEFGSYENYNLDENDDIFVILLKCIKSHRIAQFEKLFKTMINEEKSQNGKFYQHLIKTRVIFLYQIAKKNQCFNFMEFMSRIFPLVSENSTLSSNLYNERYLRIYDMNEELEKNENAKKLYVILTESDEIDPSEVKNIIVKTFKSSTQETNRIIFFGRKFGRQESLFEMILSKPKMNKIIMYIWDQLELKKEPHLVFHKNHLGKCGLEYSINSRDPCNLIAIIKSDNYHRFISLKLKEFCNKNLFEYYISLTETNLDDVDEDGNSLIIEFFNVIFHFIEDFDDVNEIPIQSVLDMLNVKVNSAIFYIHDLLCLILAHYETKNFNESLKTFLIDLNPIFQLLFLIIDGDEEIFVKNFEDNLCEIEEFCIKYFYIANTHQNEILSSFKFVLIFASIVHDRRKIIDKIFESENFATAIVELPKNVKVYKGSYYAAQKMLESGYGDTMCCIPRSWMPSKVFEDFLDSRIRKIDENLIEIDTTFLIHQNTKKQSILNKKDVSLKHIFWDDTEGLNEIISNEEINEHLVHPVISNYVELKSLKYRKIFEWNFWIYMIHFMLYFYYVSCEVADQIENEKWWNVRKYSGGKFFSISLAMITPIYLSIREIFQLLNLNDGTFWEKFKSHFSFESNKDNLFEVFLIFSILLSIVLDIFEYDKIYKLSAINILIFIGILSTMFPYIFMYFQMELFRKAAKTFFRFLIAFVLLLYAYLMVFEMIFEFKNNFKDDDEVKFFLNFRNSSFGALKTLLMLSGEYSIEPFTLNLYEILIFSTFVILTYILFNLIVGLTFSDVQQMRSLVMKIVLKHQFEKLQKTNKVYFSFYKDSRLQEEKNLMKNDLKTAVYEIYRHLKNWTSWKCFKDEIKNFYYFLNGKLMIFLVSNYPFLHKIDKFYVNIQNRKILVTEKLIEVKVLNFPIHFFFDDCLKVNKESLDTFMKIVSNQKYVEFYDGNLNNNNSRSHLYPLLLKSMK